MQIIDNKSGYARSSHTVANTQWAMPDSWAMPED